MSGSLERRLRSFLENKTIVFDANMWIHGLLGTEPTARLLLDLCARGILRVVVDSYCIAEVLRALTQLAIKKRMNPRSMHRNLWRILNADNIIKDFREPLSISLLNYVIRRDEICLIARILDLEPKDVPYLLTAFRHSATIITTDDRSLYARRKPIKERLNIEIISTKDIKKITKEQPQ